MKRWLLLLGVLLLTLLDAASAAQAGCAPRVLGVQAARADGNERPVHGWESVELPDTWTRRWPGWSGNVWYRIDWERSCTQEVPIAEPVALDINGISMAGEVFSNGELLWRDDSMQEPLSRSWNMPRWWVLPESSLHAGVNAIWVRVVGVPELSPGLGQLQMGPMAQVQALYARNLWRQRTVYTLTAGMAAAVGGLFFVVWLLRRREQAFGWYALVSLSWAAYMATILATSPWPLEGIPSATLAMSRLNIAVFVVYVLAFCMFTWRFSGQRLPRVEKALHWLTGLAVAAVLLVPAAGVALVMSVVWQGFALALLTICVQIQWYVWRPRPGGRNVQHMMLALCWLLLLTVGVHDVLVILRMWHAHETWSAVIGPVTTLLMALLVGGRLAAGMQRIERFNHELAAGVAEARAELAQALAREHAQALENAKLQERVQIAHDLHDGLGGSLVRGLALVEQARDTLPNERVLSLLKSLRDDLRQVIDHGSSAGAAVPDTPVQWAAPLRHRFTGIFDELGVASQWSIAPRWREPYRPSALQCMGLTRLMEEALSNVIKHSRARHLKVVVQVGGSQPGTLTVHIEDDGVGFDVIAVQRAGLSVGMRSMAARVERIGGSLTLQSGPCGTLVGVVLELSLAAGSPQ